MACGRRAAARSGSAASRAACPGADPATPDAAEHERHAQCDEGERERRQPGAGGEHGGQRREWVEAEEDVRQGLRLEPLQPRDEQVHEEDEGDDPHGGRAHRAAASRPTGGAPNRPHSSVAACHPSSPETVTSMVLEGREGGRPGSPPAPGLDVAAARRLASAALGGAREGYSREAGARPARTRRCDRGRRLREATAGKPAGRRGPRTIREPEDLPPSALSTRPAW